MESQTHHTCGFFLEIHCGEHQQRSVRSAHWHSKTVPENVTVPQPQKDDYMGNPSSWFDTLELRKQNKISSYLRDSQTLERTESLEERGAVALAANAKQAKEISSVRRDLFYCKKKMTALRRPRWTSFHWDKYFSTIVTQKVLELSWSGTSVPYVKILHQTQKSFLSASILGLYPTSTKIRLLLVFDSTFLLWSWFFVHIIVTSVH